ncbi:AraC family transcriptional regulator ligand-binding domain-containing protein [Caulobacter sp. KR2-114]|uniref:AraC family transcriptional regulator n=1 Tax=Caulobacter sp. KR2-114 TaxID=3400912 RepID=UPI003C0D4AC8
MPRTTLIQGLTLDRAIAVARQRGLDCRPFLRRAGVRRVPDAWAGQTVANDLFAGLLHWAAQEAGDPHFGLRVGAAFQPGDLGALGYLLMNAPTIADALVAAARWFVFQQDGGFFEVRRLEPGEVMLLYDGGDLAEGPRRQDAECGLAIISTLLHAIVGARPLAAYVRHALDEGDKALASHFGCPVQGACPDNALVYDPALFTSPIRGADPLLFRILAEHIARKVGERPPDDDVVGTVEWRIGRVLADGGAVRLPLVAEAMGLSARTLQRRLTEEGQSFASVLDRVRRTLLSEAGSRPGRTWAELAPMLGFANAGALHKWRRRQGPL